MSLSSKKEDTDIYIITPSFNAQATISRTIESVISQYGDFNIYYHIQDGGSTDRTISIIKKWQNLLREYPLMCKSVNFTYSSEIDNGMYDAIVKGFDTVLPKEEGWLSWINSDDFYMQGAFATLDKINKSSNLSSTVQWITGACLVNRETMPVSSYSRALSRDFIRAGLSDGKFWEFIQQEGTFFKRSLWDKINKTDGFSHLKYAGDWNLWRQFAEYTEIYQFKYPLASFSIINGQLSQTARSDYEKETESIISREERLNFFKNMDVENIKSLYLSASFENPRIEIEEQNIITQYRSKAKYFKIDTRNIKVDYANDREALIKKQNEIIEQLKKSTAKKFEEIVEQNKQLEIKGQKLQELDQIIKEQNKIVDNYSLVMEKIKILSQTKARKHPFEKLKYYKEVLNLFDSLKYKKKIKKKVFIFANCHGNIYKEVLLNADKRNVLEVEHLLSYENLGNYENIKHKFSECDILIIQPVQNYEKFKIENLLPLLKKDCTVIRIPFIRFNGYWDKNDVRELRKFKQPAVMFFPDIKEEDEALKYIDGDLLNESQITACFKSAVNELKNLEKQGDIKFVDFIMENHQLTPLFRDAYDPTQTMYNFISHQLVETVRNKVPSLSKSYFSIPKKWEKEYGHFKPIDNTTAKILGLEYDLDSYFKYSRSTYLKAILHHENRINSNTIDDLSNLTKVLNNFDDTKGESSQTLSRFNNCIAYDKEWQFPAITEQHAFLMLCNNKIIYDNDSIYIAFPWATLIDLLDRKNDRSDILLDALSQIKKEITGKKNIITVCQHINMLRYQDIFKEVGVTDIFWTHAVKDQYTLPKYKNIKIHPFPLYPVQIKDKYSSNTEREYLYSFVGARATDFYLTQSRNFIIDILTEESRGLVIGRDSWHYNKIVYDHQIKKEVDSNSNLVDNSASVEFQDIVKKSIFSLCPSGSGPNSIRLWESIGFGAIPVILADTYLPPGNLKLWEEAVVYCEETEEAIRALPNRLEKIAKDPELLATKRHAMYQLWMIYGPDCFVYDIQKLLLLNHGKQSSLENSILEGKK